MTSPFIQQIADNRVCQVLTCLPEKFVVDFANGIDVAQEHIRTAASFSPAGRCYVALEELRWGAFGDVIRQGETGQVNQLLDILRHKALTQMAQESGGSATVRLNTLDWLGGQGREQADNEWHDAINWLGDWCSEEQHPVIWSTTQAAEHLPVRMPRLCSAERLSESMVDEIFQKGAA
ncbi:diguanylate cyclase regulator RdcB family protein [Escherichia coli]|uniref:diguanylate cyclase regulator RdcB family protein n=1 Tax=Escherichia coli TaxID=562 RepID=UPI002F412908